jgi:hypothetical protein
MAIDGRTHYEGCWAERGHHDCAERRIAALEAQLKALDWTPITAENLPKVGHEVGQYATTIMGALSDRWISIKVLAFMERYTVKEYGEYGWTHFRPNNPPQAGGSNV